jgi:hypothetical protein
VAICGFAICKPNIFYDKRIVIDDLRIFHENLHNGNLRTGAPEKFAV